MTWQHLGAKTYKLVILWPEDLAQLFLSVRGCVNLERTEQANPCQTLSHLRGQLDVFFLKGRSAKTVESYSGAWKSWTKWCTQVNKNQLGQCRETLALYFIHLVQDNRCSVSKINNHFHGIQWGLVREGVSIAFMTDPWLRMIVEGCRRHTQHRVTKLNPLTALHLEKLIDKFIGKSCVLPDLRDVCFILLSFAGFLRFSEINNLIASDIEFHDNYFRLFIQGSKTDIYREGEWVVVAKTGRKTCPYDLLRKYVMESGIDLKSNEYVFRPVSWNRSKQCYFLRGSTLKFSYTRAREVFKSKLAAIGEDPSKFGLHSARSGGSSAAANFGVPDRLFKRHGRWKSETAKDGYIKDSLHDLLSVSKNLGI